MYYATIACQKPREDVNVTYALKLVETIMVETNCSKEPIEPNESNLRQFFPPLLTLLCSKNNSLHKNIPKRGIIAALCVKLSVSELSRCDSQLILNAFLRDIFINVHGLDVFKRY